MEKRARFENGFQGLLHGGEMKCRKGFWIWVFGRFFTQIGVWILAKRLKKWESVVCGKDTCLTLKSISKQEMLKDRREMECMSVIYIVSH